MILKRNLYFINGNPSERHHDMVTATEAGKQRMNSLPLVGLQRKKEYIVNTVTSEWSYKHPFMHKVYCCLMDFGDMSYQRCKVAIREPSLYEHIYDEVRSDMLEAGRLKTAEEAAEDRKHKDKKKFDADVARVQAEGMKKLEKEAQKAAPKPVGDELVSQEKHTTLAGSTGVRNGTVMEAALSNAKPDLKTNSRISPEGLRLKKLLSSYSLSQLKTISVDDFRRDKGWYGFKDANFQNHRRTLIQQLEREKTNPIEPTKAGPVVEAPAQPQQAPVIPNPIPQIPDSEKQKAIKILLTLPIEDVDPAFRPKLKEKLKFVFAEMSKTTNGGEVSIVTLDDPACLEVRKTVYY